MAIETIKKSGVRQEFKDDRGGAVLISTPVIGIVKDNIDPNRTGRIKVYIAKFANNDPNNAGSWLTVKYMSPFFGTIAPDYDIYNTKNQTEWGTYKGNPHSYGFWGSAPDIGTEVICVFVNGDPQDGYYIGSVPTVGLNHMVPAIAATNKIVPNEGESTFYGGADRLPTTEINYGNIKVRNLPNMHEFPKPIHQYQAAILAKQGLIRDNLRGVISSSGQRESPSKVFGISTPGNPIYEGGYTNATIYQALTPENTDKLQVIGRTGGHSIVMDDGNYKGQDQLMRFRTAGGHMIMMNDFGQVLTIIHSNGQSYIELGKEGTIDMYATNSVNVRTNGDFNVHADQDVNIHAKRNLNVFAENINVESDKGTKIRVGTNFETYTLGKFTVKVDQQMSLFSAGNSSFTSEGINYIVGQKVHLNTGNTGTIPEQVKVITKTNHIDTTFSQNVGWMNPSPDPLVSVTTRAPAHMPWVGANKGVAVKVDNAQPPSQPQPSASVTAATSAAGTVPTNPTTPALASTISTVSSGASEQMPASTITAMASQNAVNAANTSVAEKVAKGIAPGVAGVTFGQLSAPGQALKPGSGEFIQKLQQLSPNLPITKLASNVLMTGNNGVTDAVKLVNNTAAQLQAFGSAVGKAVTGLNAGNILSGKESPTQIAGVVMAAATQGVKAVSNVLSNASSVATSIKNSDIGKSIASGTFAAQMADKISSGFSGAVESIGAISGDVLKTVSSGISKAVGQLGGGISAIVGSLAGAAKTAFAVAEKSFGALKAGEPNTLGGGKVDDIPTNELLDSSIKLNKAAADLAEAQKNLVQALKKNRDEGSADSLSEFRTAQSAVAAAEQKLAGIKQSIVGSAAEGTNIGQISAQTLSAIAASADSGQLNSPNTLNTGINSLPGGVGAFVNRVNSITSNVVSSIKGITGSIQSNLQNPASLAGNLVTNVKSAITTVTKNISGNLQGLSGIVSGAQGALEKVAANASSIAAGLASNIKSQLGSLGNSPGQVKQAILATDTFTTKVAVSSKIASVIGDPSIPTPVFDESIIDQNPDTSQKEQLLAQQKIETLFASREEKALQLTILSESYNSTQNVALLSEIDSLNAEISSIDTEIVGAQEAYYRIITA